jgi:amino acid transporter
MAVIKIGGIAMFAIGGLWAAGFSFSGAVPGEIGRDCSIVDFMGAFALSVLAYAGFTTITNSGEEIEEPHRNVSRAIILSLLICATIYLLVSLAVASSLDVDEIIRAKDYTLAEAARPAFKNYGVWFTVTIAIVATVSGLIANVFAVSRMTAMLTDMKLIPHSHFGMPGRIQKHMLVYTVIVAIILTVLFDLTRIASIGIIFYLTMDIVIQWCILRNLRQKIQARPIILVVAIVLDFTILAAFLWTKANSDLLIVIVTIVLIGLIYIGENIWIAYQGS